MLAFYLAFLDENADEQKFVTIYNKYRHFMFCVANSFVKDSALAEDCVQEAFICIAKTFDKIGDADSSATKSYIMAVTRSVSINKFNAEHRHSAVALGEVEEYLEAESNCEDEVMKNYDVQLIADKLEHIPEIYREPLILRYAHDLSYDKIVQILKISPQTARKRVERAKALLLKLLKNDITA